MNERTTAVWQNGGFSAKFKFSSSIELLCKIEDLCFDFRHFAKLQTVTSNARSSKSLSAFNIYNYETITNYRF